MRFQNLLNGTTRITASSSEKTGESTVAGEKISRENNFALLHFLGACMVIYGHQWALLGRSVPGFLGNSVSTLGVKMIFVITGFLITRSFLRSGNLREFLKRRLIRIFPALIFCILLTVFSLSLVSRLRFPEYFKWSFSYVWHNILLYPWYNLPGVFEANPYPNAVNGSLWTMPVEVAMYFVIGILLWLKTKIRKESLGRCLYTAVALLFVLFEAWKDVTGTSFSLCVWGTNWAVAMDLIPYMFIGSLFEAANLKKYCNLQIAAALLLLSCGISFRNMELLTFVVLPYTTMSFALCEKPFFAHWFKKNNIAYGMYLWGFPIQQLLIYFIQVRAEYYMSPNLYFALSLAPIIGMALLSHRLIEKPIEGLLKRLLIHKTSTNGSTT